MSLLLLGVPLLSATHGNTEEDTLGVFRLGRVKSLETLGTIVGLLNFIVLGNVDRVEELG